MTGRRVASQPALAVAGLALVAAIPGLRNGFVYDDVPIIVQNPLVHQLTSAPDVWTSTYWPAGLLYRPLTIQLFAVEWAAGGGSPFAYHLVSIGLAVATALLFWRLARRLLPPVLAFLVTALFAVHPVHVEAVGNVVGQSELLVALFSLTAVERYLAWRAHGELNARRRGILAVLTLLAIFSKETGYVLPLLVLAAELTVVRAAGPPAWRFRDAVPTLQLQGAVVVMGILVRTIVLGPSVGEVPAIAFGDLSPPARVVGMLAVIPEWLRLLLWPVHLQGEYGPPALDVAGSIGPAHFLGLGCLLAALALVTMTWRRTPVVAFGLGWTAVALAPVSNVLATGLVLAERTLFLPSAGALLAAGGGLAWLLNRPPSHGARKSVLVLAGVAIAACLIRSVERQTVWRSNAVFFERLVRDAPRTARAHRVASVYHQGTGNLIEADSGARRALRLNPADPRNYEQLSLILRIQKRCAEALPFLEDGVRRFPDGTVIRARMIECALAVGDTARALHSAEEAVALGQPEFERTVQRFRR